MLTQRIILASGMNIRWNHESVRQRLPDIKQLIKVNGEVLISRIQRQFPDSIVVSCHAAIRALSEQYFFSPLCNAIVETLYDTRELWKDRTVVLLGDVFYTYEAVNLISEAPEGVHFFGNKQEIFAMVFTDRKKVLEGIEKLNVCEKRYRKLWHLYRILHSIPLKDQVIGNDFTYINDRTTDFDTKKQYLKWHRKRTVM